MPELAHQFSLIPSVCYNPIAMIEHIEAIYEQGVFRPLTALPLAENERVHLIVKSGQQDWLDAVAHRRA